MTRYFIALLFFPFVLLAQEKMVIDLCYEEWKPFAYEENGINKGVVVDNLTKAAKKITNLTLRISELPHARCVHLVEKGFVDFALFVDNSEGLILSDKKLVDWNIAAITRVNNPLESIDELVELTNSTFIISQGYEYPELFLAFLQKLSGRITSVSYYLTNDIEAIQLFSLITKGQADVMFVDKLWAHQLKKIHNLEISISPFSVHIEPQYIGHSKTSKEKVEIINKLLND